MWNNESNMRLNIVKLLPIPSLGCQSLISSLTSASWLDRAQGFEGNPVRWTISLSILHLIWEHWTDFLLLLLEWWFGLSPFGGRQHLWGWPTWIQSMLMSLNIWYVLPKNVREGEKCSEDEVGESCFRAACSLKPFSGFSGIISDQT